MSINRLCNFTGESTIFQECFMELIRKFEVYLAENCPAGYAQPQLGVEITVCHCDASRLFG